MYLLGALGGIWSRSSGFTDYGSISWNWMALNPEEIGFNNSFLMPDMPPHHLREYCAFSVTPVSHFPYRPSA